MKTNNNPNTFNEQRTGLPKIAEHVEYNLINKQTGLTEYVGAHIKCIELRAKLLTEVGVALSRPYDYYIIQKA